MPGNKTYPLADRFWAKVPSRTDGCWEWLASRNEHNYGRIGRGGKHGRIELAHRIAWELTYGLIPEGQAVLHRCDNPPCVRPDHLFLGSQQDNMADMAAKGRAARSELRGSEVGTSKLAEADVLAIRASALTNRELAHQYGVCLMHISAIRNRRLWRHI